MRILIAGYYGFGNLGDELILTSLLERLRDRYSNGHITVLSADHRQTSRHHKVEAMSRWNPLALVIAFWRADLFVLGGGGLLQDATSSRSMAYYVGLLTLARGFSLPITLYAIGVERIRSFFWKWATARVLSGAKVRIVVRDEKSRDLLVSYGIQPAGIHVAADPVFGRPPARAAAIRYDSAGRTVLLIPRLPCPAPGVRLFTHVSRVLQNQFGRDVRGMLFQPVSERPYLTELSGRVFLPEVPFIAGESWEESAALVGSFDAVISARFHGLVLAALAQRPFIGVGDPEKIGRLCESFGAPFLPWDAGVAEIDRALRWLNESPAIMAASSLERFRSAAAELLTSAAFPTEKEGVKTSSL